LNQRFPRRFLFKRSLLQQEGIISQLSSTMNAELSEEASFEKLILQYLEKKKYIFMPMRRCENGSAMLCAISARQ